MITGSCLCRGIQFRIRGKPGSVAQCHCEDCRKAQGSAFAANASVARADFSFTSGEPLLASYESSPGKHRAFCSRCGSPIFSRRDDDPATLRVRLGTLDGDPGVRPVVHGWVGDKAPWERMPEDGLPRFATGSPDSVMPRLKLRAEDPSSPDARTLIAALDADLARTYPPEVIFGLHDDDHDDARMVFLVARLRDRPVACGALRSLDRATGEVKRMFVVPELRGTGISRRMLAAIETIAIGRRHEVLRLETGKLSPAPLSLYRTSGYREIPLYGGFRDANVLAVGDVASPERDPVHDWFAGGWLGGRIDSMDDLLELANDTTLIVPSYGPATGTRCASGPRRGPRPRTARAA